jgi:demethylmenaquinone methyltransferase/2-methoxy-6-polyprenyl-1,4-benzoquinol methylase
MGDDDTTGLLQQQIAYYRARAGEYDEWFLRQGRYDRGPALNARWFAEVEEVRRALDAFAPAGDVLEVAAGTGLWTEQLARHATRLTAVDSSPEVLALNRDRVRSDAVEYVTADLFAWRPARRYDAVFFSFWLSHVPPERFEAFWALVRDCLAPGGRVFLVDSRRDASSTARDHVLPAAAATTLTRRLNDGRTFEIVKVFHEPDALAARLVSLGWDADLHATERFFLYGSFAPRA